MMRTVATRRSDRAVRRSLAPRRGLATLGAFVVALSAFALPCAARTPDARAADTSERAEPSLELWVLHATHTKRGIDASLRDLAELKKPPFSSFDSYALLERARLPLARGRTATHRLPNGRVLGAELLALEQNAVRVATRISEPAGGAFLPLLEVRARSGQHFIVAGQSYKSGILVLVLSFGS
jgi:hypothetical protein